MSKKYLKKSKLNGQIPLDKLRLNQKKLLLSADFRILSLINTEFRNNPEKNLPMDFLSRAYVNVQSRQSFYKQEKQMKAYSNGLTSSPTEKLLMRRLICVKRCLTHMSRVMRFPTMWYVRSARAQTSLRRLIRAFASLLNIQ